MEKRLILAIALSFAIIILYQLLFIKKPPQPDPAAESDIQTYSQTVKPELPTQDPPEAPEPAPEENFSAISETSEANVIVDTSLYRAVWSNQGAVLISWTLKQHKDENNENLEIVPARAEQAGKFPFSLKTDDPQFDRLINQSLYQSSTTSLELNNGGTGEIRFLYSTEDGHRVEKIFTFRDGAYDFQTQVYVWKFRQRIEPFLLWGPSIGNPSPIAQKQRFSAGNGIAVFPPAKVARHAERKYKIEESLYNFVSWAAYEDNYFTALFLTLDQNGNAAFLKEVDEEASYYFLSVNKVGRVFIGPKQFEVLQEFGYETKRLIRFGLFGFIAEILYRAIKSIHSVFPNWGVSIIILTFIIKIIFFPLTLSSSKSMAKMQELQPKIKALRAKYKKSKSDMAQRRKLNEDTMRLYKEHGVNPAGGCLPMLIQLPIFWGFFRLLVTAIEFRHSPFMLWINDLSVKDPYYVTPILMGITQFINQKMTPTSADPAQQRMMLIMPVIMTIFFMNFQSGLVIYWLTNNILQIGQQYITNRYFLKKKRGSDGKRRKK